MNTLGSLNKTERDFERPEPRKRPLALIAVASCLLIAIISGLAYFLFFRQPAQNLSAQKQEENKAVPAASTEAQIFEDEPILKDAQAVIGGRVRNISRTPLSNLSLEFELKRRSDGSTETRTVSVEPSSLAPGEEGKYSFTLPRQQFSGTQIKHLRSSARSDFVAFKTAPGARRPRELPNEPPVRTINVPRPSPRSSDEEFINTPDAPTRVP